MKTTTSAALLAFSLLLLSGCQEDFLNRKPKGQLTFDTFFENQEQAEQSVNAVYASFRAWEMSAFPWIGITDILSDDADKGSSPNDALYMLELDEFTFDATNQILAQAWSGHYQTIARANLAIENIPAVDMEQQLKDRLVGEAKFLRALCYFRLVQWFGDLPLITRSLADTEYFSQVRSPKAQVYDQIEQDLKAALAALPEKSEYADKDLGRATRGAARGILAKLSLLKQDFVGAQQYCLEIINSGEYSLLPRYADNFLPVGENGSESVFEIGATAIQAAVAGPGSSPFNMIQGVRGVPNLGWGFNRPSDDLVAAYESGDPRRQATIIYVGEVLPDGSTVVEDNPDILNERYNQKAWVPDHPGLQDNGPGNLRYLRYADVLLMAAEALNENGQPEEALIYLNQVRARARGTNNFILPNVTATDQAELRERIYRERRIELAMEQHRWFDLLRWGRVASVMQAVGKNFTPGKHELLPLPQTEVDLSGGKLAQNPGY